MAAVWALALFTTRTVSLFLSRKNAMRTEWKRGESDEILSHGSTSRGVILALFMAAVRHSLAAPVLLFGTLGGHLQQHASIPKLSASSQNRCSTLWQSILVRSLWGPGHGLIAKSLPIDAWKYMISRQSHEFSCHLGIIALTTGINCRHKLHSLSLVQLLCLFARAIIPKSHSNPCDYL